jgi:SAM-dependent methyltransferase
MTATPDQVVAQRDYYAATADRYEALHMREHDEHDLALAWLSGLVAHYGARSVMDIGCGTGRAPLYLRRHQPEVRVLGVEPSAELRAIGHAAGIAVDALVDGDATHLAWPDDSFDIVCEFGVLHHVRNPRVVIAEMLRVARLGIFISDDNHFAAGSTMGRAAKRALDAVGLWPAAYWLRSGGKGYRISEGDGLSYPYSVFDDLGFIESRCDLVQMGNMTSAGTDFYAQAAHVALFGRKRGGTCAPR